LFAAFDVLEGKVIGQCMKRHRHQELSNSEKFSAKFWITWPQTKMFLLAQVFSWKKIDRDRP
jgi:hypothetical protein